MCECQKNIEIRQKNKAIYDKYVDLFYCPITATCPVRTGRGKTYKKIGTLSVGTKVKALYILKNSAGNLWASIDYGNDIGYICLNKAKPV